MTLPHGETVAVNRRGGTDKWGQDLPGTQHTVGPCGFAPRTATGSRNSTEDNAQRNTVITGLTMYAPWGADITSQDVIVRGDGSRWHVEGDVGEWLSPLTGWRAGIEVALVRVSG